MKRSTKQAIAYGLLTAVTLLWILPILWMLISAFRDSSDPFYSGIFPSRLTVVNFQKILSDPIAIGSFRNSFIVAFSAATLTLLIASLAAYGFSRFRFKGQGVLQNLLLIIRLLPGVMLAISFFKLAGRLNIYDTYIPLVLINSLLNLPFATWNLRATFDKIHIEIEEAAWLDGATRLVALQKVLLPLVSPSLAATGALVFLLSWNEYLFAVSFIRSPEKQLITTTIASNIGQYNIDYTGLMSTALLASLPLLLVFILIQRYILSGLTIGAVKG